MKVFISYGSTSDQVTALRLQALGAVNGLTIYVPPAFTREGIPQVLTQEANQKLQDAEVVLGIIGASLSAACSQELEVARTSRKNLVVMTYPPSAPQLEPFFGSNLVVIDPANPGAAEAGIMEYLKTVNAQKAAKNALLALGTLALGLLILTATNRD